MSWLWLAVLCWILPASPAFARGKNDVPPEYKQKVILEVPSDFEMFQAPRSKYDIGDLQNFHTQHTLPILVEDVFKEIFGQVDVREPGAPKIESGEPEVPAIFEARLIDVANDISAEGVTNYRGSVTLAVAMKSPRGKIFWQKAFRGDGYADVDPQFSNGLGPQDALVDAMRDALDQMKKAILESPEVRNQMKYYLSIQAARREKEVRV